MDLLLKKLRRLLAKHQIPVTHGLSITAGGDPQTLTESMVKECLSQSKKNPDDIVPVWDFSAENGEWVFEGSKCRFTRISGVFDPHSGRAVLTVVDAAGRAWPSRARIEYEQRWERVLKELRDGYA